MALSGTSTWKATSRLRVLICGGGIGLDAPSGEAAANGAGGSVPGPGLAMEPLDADAMTSAERAFEPGAGASGSVLAWTASARPRPWRSVLRHRPVSTEQRSGGTVPHPGAAGCASGCSDRAADRQVDLGFTPQPGIVHDARQQAGQHQPQGRLRIDAGPHRRQRSSPEPARAATTDPEPGPPAPAHGRPGQSRAREPAIVSSSQPRTLIPNRHDHQRVRIGRVTRQAPIEHSTGFTSSDAGRRLSSTTPCNALRTRRRPIMRAASIINCERCERSQDLGPLE